MQRLLVKFAAASEVHPIKVLSATNAIICAIGDVISQSLQISSNSGAVSFSMSQKEFDIMRTLRFAAWGFIMGPVVNRWYLYLNRNFPLHEKTGEIKNGFAKLEKNTTNQKQHRFSDRILYTYSLAKRVAADQILFAPVGLVAFFTYMNIVENRPLSALHSTLSNKYLETMKSSYMIWPLFQLTNFSVIPLQLRVPVGSLFGILWNVYLSYIHAR